RLQSPHKGHVPQLPGGRCGIPPIRNSGTGDHAAGSRFDQLSAVSPRRVAVFLSPAVLSDSTWRAYERLVSRLASYLGFSGIRAVGQTNDGGADLIAHKDAKRWLFQVKRLGTKVGPD